MAPSGSAITAESAAAEIGAASWGVADEAICADGSRLGRGHEQEGGEDGEERELHDV
ncbi:predicted protein [Uncinocarpus reesii 1704]|uniref:Uncharacterized protein n=1 Tax=Uncinocarpus reesii (strain UAMH 1704) TaxID=336963 RepID=C4JD98_UNCRE|nr:uncharacterized protein UREG_00293 [Uncinocarpus reesii 1704]EEP75447.1 predicted protein [Uncinocarpus reesii 1704]